MTNGNGTKLRRKRCGLCRRFFSPKTTWQEYCSVVCGDRVRQKRRAERIRKALAAEKGREEARHV